jgi:hypothetical protein
LEYADLSALYAGDLSPSMEKARLISTTGR